MGEFAFIRDHLAPFAGEGSEGLTDDCAYLPDGDGWLAISTDTSIEGVHFPHTVKGAAASERAVRTALSDLAAKAATPIGMCVNLTLPKTMEDLWVNALALGLEEASRVCGCPLLGGDTTRHDGKLVISVTAIGRTQRKMLRLSARAGDGIWLSGPVGDAALGLRYLQGDPPMQNLTGDDLYRWEEAFLRPIPRFDIASTLLAHARATIDISDGLLADAKHVATASGVALHVQADAIPFSDTSMRYIDGERSRLVELATAGDDYQVLVTTDADLSGANFTRIGDVVEGEGVALMDGDGYTISVDRLGYTHT